MPSPDQIVLEEVLKHRRDQLSSPILESTYFELFAGEQALKDYDLSWDEVESGLVGNGGDGGIDGFYLFINGEVVREDTDISDFRGDIRIELHIIQAKERSGFSEAAIQKLRTTTEDLLDISKDISSLEGVYNTALIESVRRFRDAFQKYVARMPELTISYYYATLGDEVHPNVQRQVIPLREMVSRLFGGSDFSFDFLGARGLLDLTRKKPKTTYELKLSDSPISTLSNAYVCLVRLDEYYRFITDGGGPYIKSMFDANVRDHQGNVQVNKGIRDSLHNPQGEDFWWLNNGVTILASKAVLSAKTLTIENPRIVNGLQTSIEIHKYFENADSDEDRSLLVRVIVPEHQESNERIIKATNSQTSIPIASLRATDKVHRDIEDYFKAKGLYYDRRKNQYKNEGKPLDRIVSIGYVAQAVMSIALGRPDDARARPSTLLKSDDDYEMVFNANYPPDTFLKPTQVLRIVEDHLRSERYQFSRKDVNNVRFQVTMFVSWLLMNTTNPSIEQVSNLRIEDLSDELIETSIGEVWKVYESLGGDDQVSKGPQFVKLIKERLSELTFKGRITRSVNGS
jgi:hypothetical protein